TLSISIFSHTWNLLEHFDSLIQNLIRDPGFRIRRLVCFDNVKSLTDLEPVRLSLVSSGCVDGVVGVAARVASVQAPWISLEDEPSPDLTNHIVGLETMLSEMQLRVPVAFWSVEATQPAWVEAGGDLDDLEDNLEDLMEVEVISNNNSNKTVACCQPACWGCVG
ncbi:regulator of G-protein signaling 9-binding protein-like, partial [Plectropomus leopardus]|uniref:regulator of G-protein signaling 9-binding protein-like n=1 Tax=Plectropomus leopardus TaxID=160734 RepID=UPI001C4AE798